MINCRQCDAENLTDAVLCPTCMGAVRFKHRDGCDCRSCGAQIVEINGLSELTEYAIVDGNFQPINGEIDPDYEAAWAARESREAAA